MSWLLGLSSPMWWTVSDAIASASRAESTTTCIYFGPGSSRDLPAAEMGSDKNDASSGQHGRYARNKVLSGGVLIVAAASVTVGAGGPFGAPP